MENKKTLKVLAIGNSFSEDSMAYLWEIAHDYGIEEIILGNLYVPGCSLESHVYYFKNALTPYIYFKNTTKDWIPKKDMSLLYGLKDEAWDFITIQQVSGKSGLKDTFEPYLSELIDYVTKEKTNPNALLGWNMTWAYEEKSNHSDFIYYQNDQKKMYQAIVEAVQTEILSREDIDFLIPTGTAIQNVRREFIVPLTRDGYHLTLDYGRYIASLMWFKTLTNASLDSIQFSPNGVKSKQVLRAKKAAQNASLFPFEVK